MSSGEQGTLFASMRALVRELTVDLSETQTANVHVVWLDHDDSKDRPTTTYHVFVNDRNSSQVPLQTACLERFEHALRQANSATQKQAARRWLLSHSPADEAKVAIELLDGTRKPTSSPTCRASFHLLYSAVPGAVDRDVISMYLNPKTSPFHFEGEIESWLGGATGWKIRGGAAVETAPLTAQVEVWNKSGHRLHGSWHGDVSELHEALRCLIPGERPHGHHQVYVVAPIFVHGCLVGLAYVILAEEPPAQEFSALASRLEHLSRVVLPPSMQVFRFAEFDKRIVHETNGLIERTVSLPRKRDIEKVFLRHVHLLVRTTDGDVGCGAGECREITIRHDEGSFSVLVHQDQVRLNRKQRDPRELDREARMRAQVLKQVLRTKFANTSSALRIDTERSLTRAEAALSELEHDLKNLHEGMHPRPTATDLRRWLAWISNNTRAIRANLTGTEQPVDTRTTYAGEPLMVMLSRVASSSADISAVELPERVPAAVVSLLAQLLLNLQSAGSTLRVWREASGLYSLETSAPTIAPTATLIRQRIERWVSLRTLTGRGAPLRETHGTLVMLGVLHRIRTGGSRIAWEFSGSGSDSGSRYSLEISPTPELLVKGEAADVRHLSFCATNLHIACREQ